MPWGRIKICHGYFLKDSFVMILPLSVKSKKRNANSSIRQSDWRVVFIFLYLYVTLYTGAFRHMQQYNIPNTLAVLYIPKEALFEKPVIYAHRGASAYAPENTVPLSIRLWI